MRYVHRLLPVLILLGTLTPLVSLAQDDKPETLNVFLDCYRCDFDYIRREISYVNYVRDRQDSDVHVLVTSERTGSGGNEYWIIFIGLGDFSALTDTLTYASSSTDTRDETRAGLTRRIENGLYRFVVRTGLADQLDISVSGRSERAVETANPEDDRWNSWIFNVGMSGSYEAEESSNFLRMNGSFNAGRITEDWKFRFNIRANYRQSNFDVGDQVITSTTQGGNIWALLVKSLGNHWSGGGSLFVNTSTRQNRKLYASVSSAIEFNVFPYSESNQREIRMVYTLAQLPDA